MNKQIDLNLEGEQEASYGYNEAIKSLRTNIQFCGNNIRVVMFTSTMPDEGKSSLAFSVAAAISQTGKRVLLVDADIRKSVFNVRYQIKEQLDGLSQYLSGQKVLDEVIYETNIENLSMVFAGPFPPNPSELLQESLFDKLIEYGKEFYDYIIVDTAPIGAVIDGAIVATRCDGVVMVIESGEISYRLVQRVKSQLEKSGCRILGAVLNKADTSTTGYYKKHYGKYEKTYGYGYYHHDDKRKERSRRKRLLSS